MHHLFCPFGVVLLPSLAAVTSRKGHARNWQPDLSKGLGVLLSITRAYRCAKVGGLTCLLNIAGCVGHGSSKHFHPCSTGSMGTDDSYWAPVRVRRTGIGPNNAADISNNHS